MTMSRRIVSGISMVTTIAIFICFIPTVQGQIAADVENKSIILWVRQVNGQSLYWVNDRPVGRAPLTGLAAIVQPNQKTSLQIILDSRVPIDEIFEIAGMIEKIPINDAHYFVRRYDSPTVMSEIAWKPQLVPVPKSSATSK